MIPTPAAIETAARNASRDAANYTISQMSNGSMSWIVSHKTDASRVYFLNVYKGEVTHCQCPQWKAEGVCKHACLVEEEISIRDEEVRREEIDLLDPDSAWDWYCGGVAD